MSFAGILTPRTYAQPGTMMSESAARKARSEAILLKEGVPFIAHLPMLEPLAETRFRTSMETANRAIALAMVALMGESGDYDLTQRVIQDWDAEPRLTTDELRFVSSRTPTQHDRVQFSWRYEALLPLMWAVGHVKEIGRPDRIVDVSSLVATILELGPDDFRAKADLRPRAEILDLLDLTYRYHWAVVDARLKQAEAPGGLESGVVQERHYALNWLTCYGDQDWDDVSTDT